MQASFCAVLLHFKSFLHNTLISYLLTFTHYSPLPQMEKLNPKLVMRDKEGRLTSRTTAAFTDKAAAGAKAAATQVGREREGAWHAWCRLSAFCVAAICDAEWRSFVWLCFSEKVFAAPCDYHFLLV